MSQRKSKKKVENITLFFNHHLNIFPDDFFITKNNKLKILKNPLHEENSKNELNNIEYYSGRSNTTTNFRKSIKKISTVIKFDSTYTKSKNSTFKQKNARSNFIKSKSLSDLDDKDDEQGKYLCKSILTKKNINNNKKYYMNIYNNNKFKSDKIQANELFKESSLKNSGQNINYNYKINPRINLQKKKYIPTEISKENISNNYSKPRTPLFIEGKIFNKNPKKMQKILKINNSSIIGLKYPKIKQHIRNKQILITETEKNIKIKKEENKMNKRPFTSNKQNIKTKIKNTIDNIFVELSKNCEENPDIFNKFNNLIRDVKNIQKVIKHKKASIFNNNTKL